MWWCKEILVLLTGAGLSLKDQDMSPPTAILKLGQFHSPNIASVSEENIKATGPVYGLRHQDPTQGFKRVTCLSLSLNHIVAETSMMRLR